MTDTSGHDHETRRGRRWGVIFLLVAITLAMVLFGGHGLWSAGARKGLDREVRRLKEAGEPIEPADFNAEPLADVDNGAIDLRNAARSIDQTSEIWKDYEKLSLDFPLTEKEIAAVRAAVAANPAAFASIDRAMTRKGIDWQIRLKSPVISTLLPDLNYQRELANLLAARARLEFTEGDHAAAVADVRRVRFLARATGTQPFLISHLVAVGVDALAVNALEGMSPDLKIGTGPGQVPPEQLKQLIAALLDDKEIIQSRRRGLQSERMSELDVARCIADGTLNINQLSSPGFSRGMGSGPANIAMNAVGYAIKPIALGDGALMIRHTTDVIKAIDAAGDNATYLKTMPPIPPEVMNDPYRHLVARMMMPSFERMGTTGFRSMTDRRMTAIALAIRWYAVDHGGKLPDKLSDLAPNYLPVVPTDPMIPGTKPLNYKGAATTQPILYSVGENGVDDGGSEQTKYKRPYVDRWNMLDAVMHLTRQPRPKEDEQDMLTGVEPPEPAPAATEPATQPSTEPAVHQ